MFFSVFSSQKSFSLVLEALDYDNDTSESGRCVCAVCVFVCVYLCLYASLSMCKYYKVVERHFLPDKEERDKPLFCGSLEFHVLFFFTTHF